MNIKFGISGDDIAQVEKHNCKEYEVWQNTKEYNCIVCIKCNRVIKFSFKNIFKRIRSLFWNRIS